MTKPTCLTCKHLRNELAFWPPHATFSCHVQPALPRDYCLPTPCGDYVALAIYADDSPDDAAMPPQHDPVERPAHYQLLPGVEAIDIIEARGWLEGFCLGSALEYLLRAGVKSADTRDEDLRKAQQMIAMLLERQG